MDGKPTILFDGCCNLCSGFVRFLLRRNLDGSFRLVPAQSPAGETLIEAHHLHDIAFDSVVLIEAGGVTQRTDAALRILRRLPFPWNLGALLRFVPRSIRDRFYRIVAANRYRWFGNSAACAVGKPPTADRFLPRSEVRTQREK